MERWWTRFIEGVFQHSPEDELEDMKLAAEKVTYGEFQVALNNINLAPR